MDFTKRCTIAIKNKYQDCLSSACAYLSRTGRRVAVILHGLKHPAGDTAERHCVYLYRDVAESCESPDELLELAASIGRSWIDKQRLRNWKAELIELCRPLRVSRKPALAALAAMLNRQYGDFWTTDDGRWALFDYLADLFPAMSFPKPP